MSAAGFAAVESSMASFPVPRRLANVDDPTAPCSRACAWRSPAKHSESPIPSAMTVKPSHSSSSSTMSE